MQTGARGQLSPPALSVFRPCFQVLGQQVALVLIAFYCSFICFPIVTGPKDIRTRANGYVHAVLDKGLPQGTV